MGRLPKDIPHRQILLNAGFTNYGVLKNHRSLESIRGLAGKKAQDVKDYLQGGKKSKDYSIADLRNMDLSDKDESFFEGDDRKSINQFK